MAAEVRPKANRCGMLRLFCAIVLSTLSCSATAAEFNWTLIRPSGDLSFVPCYEIYECARLSVPLDWDNNASPNSISLAIIKLPAVVPSSDSTFGGTILINPGGPGGSGVDVIRWSGPDFRRMVDSDDKHFEVLSWDPRGVRFTTPPASCFASDWQRKVWEYKGWALGQLDGSRMTFDEQWAMSQAFGQLCHSTDHGVYPDGANIRNFATTAHTARDMIQIIDQIDVHRQQATGLAMQAAVRPKSHARLSPPPLLNYIGLSYGTYLGNTFASMFPSRIGRMLLDGNVDADDYRATGWLSNLQDSNQSQEMFYDNCFRIGVRCGLVDDRIRQAADLKHKVTNLLSHLQTNPIPFVAEGTADIITHQDVANLIHQSLYVPHFSWPMLARILGDLSNGNMTSMLPKLRYLRPPRALQHNLGDHTYFQHLFSGDVSSVLQDRRDPWPPSYPQTFEAAKTVLCSDGDDIRNKTKLDWHHRLETLAWQSPIVGPVWASIPWFCTHWPFHPATRFTKPFGSRAAEYDRRASPILFVNNIADPVTPLRNAVKESAKHEGSRVLIQNSTGHCTGIANPASCTFRMVRAFFANGTLPINGTICQPDVTPWGDRID